MNENDDQLPPADFDEGTGATLADQWRANMVEAGGKKSTISTYYKVAKQFLVWAEKNEIPLNELPPNTPEEFYASLKLKPKDPRRNTSGSALKGFLNFLASIGIPTPPINYPPSVGPSASAKAGLAEWQEQQRQLKEQKAMEEANASTQPEQEVAPEGPSVDGVADDPGSNAAAGEAPGAAPEGESAAPTAAASAQEAPAAAPTAPASAPAPKRSRDYVPVEPAARRGTVDRTPNPVMAGGRGGVGVARNILKLMLPPGGRLRIMRRSDGTDGEQLGSLVPIGDYTQDDVTGYPDVKAYIQSVLHPGLPVQRAMSATYIVKEIDEYGRLSPRSSEIKIPNGLPGTQGGPHQIDAMVQERIRKLEKEADEERAKLKKELEDAQKQGNAAWTTTLLSLLDERNRKPVYSKEEIRKQVRAEMGLDDDDDDVPVRRGRIMQGSFNGYPGAAPPGPPLPPRKSDLEVLLTTFVPVMTAMVGKVTEVKKESESPLVALFVKDMLESRKTNPEVAELKAEMRRLADKNEQLTRDLSTKKESNTLQEVMANVTAFMSMQEKLGAGGGASTVEAISQMVETIADKAPQIIDSFAKLRSGQAPQIGGGQKQIAKPAEKPTLPAQAEQALRALYDMPVPSDDAGQQAIVDAVWAVIAALAQDKVWEPAARAAHQELQKVETFDDLYVLVTKLLKTCGAHQMMKQQPTFVSKIVNVLATNFPQLYQQLFGEARVLAGFEHATAAAPTPEVPSAPEGEAKETDEDEEGDEDEEEEEEEEAEGDEVTG